MQLTYVCLLVGDFSAAVSFWRDVMRFPLVYQDESIGYAGFTVDAVTLALLRRDGFAAMLGEATPAPLPVGRQAYICFKVDDVDATYATLVERGAMAVAAPQDRPGQMARNAYLSDPDGHLIEIYVALSPQSSDMPTA